jgi:hypothetical protein
MVVDADANRNRRSPVEMLAMMRRLSYCGFGAAFTTPQATRPPALPVGCVV